MNAHENTGEIMNEVDWKKDGETGCLMTLVKAGAVLVAGAALFLWGSDFIAFALLDHLW